MNILVIGSGGREHALAWKLKQSQRVTNIFIAPGNPGTAMLGENISIDISDHEAVVAAARQHAIDLVVIGPDEALAQGLTNALQNASIAVFGPTKEAAEIEWSKSFAKKLLNHLNIPTAASQTFDILPEAKEYVQRQAFPLVIKASGLALGKGVVIAHTMQEAEQALEAMMGAETFGPAGKTVIIEEFLDGEEISIHAFCDGEIAVLFPAAQDHKRIGDGDQGPNTGGMGTISPVPGVSDELLEQIKQEVVIPVLKELKRLGRPFTGVLFPGIMLTKDGPKVLEFNARFGDPETQSFVRTLKTDLAEILWACVSGTLNTVHIEWEHNWACCVVLASKGYPGTYAKGIPITGITDAEMDNEVVVFHAGTALQNAQLVTNGGRVLGVSSTGKTLEEARKKAYAAVERVHFDGKQYRTDI